MKSSKGIAFVAVGEQYLDEAKYSANRVRSVMPDINIAVVTDRQSQATQFDDIIAADTEIGSYGSKIKNMNKSPYHKTIYFDTDVYLERSINEIFDLLEGFDLAAAEKPDFQPRKYINPDIPRSFPEYNTGVLAFKKETFDKFSGVWIEKYKRGIDHGYPHDQVSFRESVFETNISFATLPARYNCRYTTPGRSSGLVNVFHGRPEGIKYGSNEFDRYINNIISDINRTDLPRVFFPTEGGGVSVHPSQSGFHVGKSRLHKFRSAYYRFRQAAKKNGVMYAMKNSIDELI